MFSKTFSFSGRPPTVSYISANESQYNNSNRFAWLKTRRFFDENNAESSSPSASAEPIEGDGDTAQTSDDDDDDDEQEDIMTKAMRLLEEDCRKLRVEKWVKKCTCIWSASIDLDSMMTWLVRGLAGFGSRAGEVPSLLTRHKTTFTIRRPLSLSLCCSTGVFGGLMHMVHDALHLVPDTLHSLFDGYMSCCFGSLCNRIP